MMETLEHNGWYSLEIKKTIVGCLCAVIITILFTTFIVKPVVVSGESMEDNYHSGEYLLVNRTAYWGSKQPERGDVIVCKGHGDELLIKRIIGLSGESIKIVDGETYIDGEVLNEPYIKEPMEDDFDESTVPVGEIFVMGDNRNNSMDSREDEIGTISENNITGKVIEQRGSKNE